MGIVNIEWIIVLYYYYKKKKTRIIAPVVYTDDSLPYPQEPYEYHNIIETNKKQYAIYTRVLLLLNITPGTCANCIGKVSRRRIFKITRKFAPLS